MGSLMAGWDSPVEDPKSVKYKKNWSFTKGEIDAYWNQKKKIQEEHLRAISSPTSSDNSQDIPNEEDGVRTIQRSASAPVSNTRGGFIGGMDNQENLEKLMKKKDGWWTRSNWAFLNEPPVIERSSNTYSSQFHIADQLAASNSKPGISA
ncbi:hypothetical protein K2173_027701 [Erythroxylum novogranatense]|uniref:Uncharacterized protein n=1 Tax=Erythroxylum novogranatense TaxID=1862640 RepID=A0AAV8U2R7_9ROSI|nr:hypothetical protein K2173_027701 [Erythroxylum novogranatense]